MTSKESLEKIKDFWLDHDGDDGVYEVKQEAFETIEKELDALEILKRVLLYPENSEAELSMTDEDAIKIREWLENDR